MITCVLAFLFQLAFAAPHPLAGSSIVNTPNNSLAMSQLGFKLGTMPTNWIYKNSSDLDSQSLEIGPANQLARSILTIRTEKVPMKTDLEKYVRQYLRDYNQYGFEVTGLQSFKKTITPSVIVDLTQKNKQTKSRQVFYHKGDKLVLATCIDTFEKFDKTVITCNRVLGGFEWR
ncbi:MAG: hypothetical protein H7061_13315 [Bdellovibrionaceae bacterium]|nr:hypothetical protein [Bdellovibrio sp.]